MPRPRTPAAVADAIGAGIKNPDRYKGRSAPKVDALGAAPNTLTGIEAKAWAMFASEMPWLARSDRTLVEVASKLRARMMTDPEMGVNALAQLRLCLSAMGGTPADRSKVSAPDDEDEDPAAEFLN